MNETWIQVLTIIGSNLVIMLIFFGISISLHNGMREEIRGIQTEMKDFLWYFTKDIREPLVKLDNDVKETNKTLHIRIDQQSIKIDLISARMDELSKRTDKSYDLFM